MYWCSNDVSCMKPNPLWSYLTQAVISSPLPSLPSQASHWRFHLQEEELQFQHMAKQRRYIFAPVALVLFGIVAILLLTIPTEDLAEPPECMVRFVWLFCVHSFYAVSWNVSWTHFQRCNGECSAVSGPRAPLLRIHNINSVVYGTW